MPTTEVQAAYPASIIHKLGRVVELSHPIVPGDEEFALEMKTFPVETILPRIERRSDIWYVLGEVRMSTHVGTHVEFPYHHRKDGMSAAEYPLDRLIGEAVLLDFSHKKKDEEITVAEIERAARDIGRGDIVLIRTDMHKLWKTPRGHDRVLAIEAAQYLAGRGIHMIGTDATGLEVRRRDDQPVHQILFSQDVAVIESMTNLDLLTRRRFTVFVLPLRIEGMDSCPVRVIACE